LKKKFSKPRRRSDSLGGHVHDAFFDLRFVRRIKAPFGEAEVTDDHPNQLMAQLCLPSYKVTDQIDVFFFGFEMMLELIKSGCALS
jgi:hypothetical protein